MTKAADPANLLNMNENELRSNLVEILDTEDGLTPAAFEAVKEMGRHISSRLPKEGYVEDIFDAVESADGKYFLPETVAQELRAI